MEQFIRRFEELGLQDVALVGGKNASSGSSIASSHRRACECRMDSR
jgi:hypothetical protein